MPDAAPKFRLHYRTPAKASLALRPSSAERGYDSTWTSFRELAIDKHKLCEHCWHFERRAVPTHELDHIIPIEGKADPLRLDAKNVRGLCRKHHARKTRRFDKRIRAYFDRLITLGTTIDRARDATVERFRFELGGQRTAGH